MTNEELDAELAAFVHKDCEPTIAYACGHTFAQHRWSFEGEGACYGIGCGCLINPNEIEIEFLRSKLLDTTSNND